MAVIGDAWVRIRPQTTGFQSETETGVLDSITGIAKKAAVIMGGIFAVKEGVDFLKSSYEAATESNKVIAQTGAVIKSTGDASKVTAAQFEELGKSIAAKTGIDHDQIQSAENLIATFTNVRNEAGKGNDIFNQTTKIAVDMGAALGGDASSNAIRLGRALQDPVAGLTALTRVGVTFSAAQKEQIKAMAASGNTMGAQKAILAELNKEFGGSAAAQATSAGKLKESWRQIQEQIGQKLVPIVNQLANLLAQYLPVAMDLAGKAFAALGKVFKPVVDAVETIIQIFSDTKENAATMADGIDTAVGAGGRLTSAFEFVINTFKKVKDSIGPITDWLKGNLGPVLGAVAALVAAVVVPAFVAWAASAASAAAAMIVAAAPVVALAAVIGGLGYAVVYAYEHFATFRNTVDEIARAVVPILQTAFEIVKALFTDVVNVVMDLWDRFGGHLLDHLKVALDAIAEVVRGLIDILAGIFDLIKAVLTGKWGEAWDALLQIFTGIWEVIKGAISFAVNEISTIIGLATAAISAAWGLIWHSLATLFTSAWTEVWGAITGAWQGIVDFFTHDAPAAIVSAARGLWAGLEDEFTAVINTIIDLFNSFTSHIPSIHLPGTNITVEAPTMQHIGHAAGGYASGTFMAGEQGPELVSLRPGGAMVYPAGSPESRGGGSLPPISIAIENHWGAGTNADDVMQAMTAVARNEMTTALQAVLVSANAGKRR
jgi:phage-related protein